MGRELSHRDLEELLGAYALDAVEGDEAVSLSAHLESCPRCRNEVIEHREVAAMLAFGGASAPEGLWDRIASSLEEAPPELDMSRIVRGAEGMGGMRGAGGVGAGWWRRSVRMRTAVTLASAAAVVIAGLGIEVQRLDHRYHSLSTAVSRQDVDRTVARAASDPNAREVALRSFDGSVAAKAFVNSDGESVVDFRSLPALPADKEYQLWALEGSAKVSVRLLGARPSVAAFRSGSKVQALAITAEHAGGVERSDNPAVVSGYL
jgi:anti-sigma factor RsiW